MIRTRVLACLACAAALAAPATRCRGDHYLQENLVTSATDPDLINPWGISHGPTTFWWVSDNGTGKSTLYNGDGVKQGLVVTMPAGGEPITGQIFNGSSNFNGDRFLFASEAGTISGWRPALGTAAALEAAIAGANYKGLAISTGQDQLFAANFATGTIDVFNGAFAKTDSFADPTAPANFAPFNVQNLDGRLLVTFAKVGPTGDDVAGAGNGFVDVFDPVTHLFTRLISGTGVGGTVDALNSPWGLALAPAKFGEFSGALLVGNFGDGRINAFDPTSGAFLGTLTDPNGNPLVNPGLWGLGFGNGGNAGSTTSLYFAAGGAEEDVGIFGRIRAVPEPGSVALLGLGGLAIAAAGLLRRRPA